VAPKEESVDLVKDWLSSATSGDEAVISVEGDYVTVQASVNTVERLLKTEYSTFGNFSFISLGFDLES
jgi:tripeptidyl-peptidase I